jgi:type I restriction enzyme S subunit
METLQPKLRFPEFSGYWFTKKIGDITNVSAGGTPSTVISEYWNGNIRWMNSGDLNLKRVYDVQNRITELGLKKSSTKIIPKSSVLIGLAGQGKTRGTVAMNMVDLCINQSIGAIFPNDKLFVSDFLYHNLDNRYDELRGLSTGDGGRGGLNLQIIKSLNINFPSLEEQTKIANFLSSIDEKINLLKEKKELLEEYKKGIMQKIFNQEIRFKDDNGNDFEDWEIKTLGDVAKFRRGSFPQPYGLSKWYDEVNGMPFIQVYDVASNMLLKPYTKNKISKLGAEQSVFVKKGTLVITIQGSIGRIAKTQYDAYIDRTLLIFQSYKCNIDVDYFKYVVFLLFEIEKTKAPGGIIKTITKEVLTDFEVPIPCIQEQTKIANFISAIDEKIDLVATQIQDTQEYKKGLLQQMFV